MLTIVEVDVARDGHTIHPMPDGWRPIAVTSGGNKLVVSAVVDTDAKTEGEVFYVLRAGDDIDEVQQLEGTELTFLGSDHLDGVLHYVFLALPEQGPVRRVSHPRLLEEQG